MPKWIHPAIGGLATGALAVAGALLVPSQRHCRRSLQDPRHSLSPAPCRWYSWLCSVSLSWRPRSVPTRAAARAASLRPRSSWAPCSGGAVGYLDVTVFHHPTDAIGAFAVVGMGAVFAGIVRAPMTSILIIFEMTGGYGLGAAADDRQHERLCAGSPLASGSGLRGAARCRTASNCPTDRVRWTRRRPRRSRPKSRRWMRQPNVGKPMAV